MVKYINKFLDWYNTPWEVKRGVYASLWYYFWASWLVTLFTTIFN